MHPLILSLLLHQTFLAGVASAERKLPADLQFDLVFPRNETYAPAQFFPIVIGVQNVDGLWPFEMGISFEMRPVHSNRTLSQNPPFWQNVYSGMGPPKIAEAIGANPSKYYFHYFGVNMTNGTAGQFTIAWSVSLFKRCFANRTDADLEADSYLSSRKPVLFSTKPGAQVPDIEAAINSCPEPNENTSVAVRVNEVKQLSGSDPLTSVCPVFDTIAPAKCGYREVASELAANISSAMLGRMGCKEGTWQTITAPCPNESGAMSWRSFEFGTGWALLVLSSLALASI